MPPLQFEKLSICKMASGHLCLNLSEQVAWADYPNYAKRLIEMCDGEIKDNAESPDIRIWLVAIAHQELQLVYQDYPQLVSLESNSNEADVLIESLHAKLSSSLP